MRRMNELLDRVDSLGQRWRKERSERQSRRRLDPDDFELGMSEHGILLETPFQLNDMTGALHWALWLSEMMRLDAGWESMWNLVAQGFATAQLQYVGGVVTRMEPDELMRCTPELIPGLVRAFNSTSADVRKAVVDALVAMYDALGDWLLPQLGGLTPAQQKLVTIYINRAMEKPNAASRAKAGGAETRVPLAPRQMQ